MAQETFSPWLTLTTSLLHSNHALSICSFLSFYKLVFFDKLTFGDKILKGSVISKSGDVPYTFRIFLTPSQLGYCILCKQHDVPTVDYIHTTASPTGPRARSCCRSYRSQHDHC